MEPIVISNNIVRPVVLARFSGPNSGGGGGAGTVTAVSVNTDNGVSGTVANPTTTPAITITLGAITPTSVAASGNVTGANLSGTNTGDQDLSGINTAITALQAVDVSLDARIDTLEAAGPYVVANVGITGATKTKITYDAKGLVTSGADATTADIADSLDRRYVTDAQLVVIGNTSGTNSGNVTLSGENYLSLAGQVIAVAAVNLSGTHVTGTLAAARFGTLTGDVTTAGGSYATTIANDAVTTAKILNANVTLAKIATQADQTFLGNNTGGAASPIALTVAQAKTMLDLTGTNSGDVTVAGENYLSIAGQVVTAAAVDLSGSHVTGTLAAARVGTFTGDVTSAGGSYALTIANDAVTTAKILNSNVTLTKVVNASTGSILLGRGDSGAGVFEEITIGSGLAMTGTTLSATGGGGGTPGGADTQIQYNDGGAFNGAPSLVYAKATDKFTFGTFAGTGIFVTVNSSADNTTALKTISSGIGGIAFDTVASGSTGVAARFAASNAGVGGQFTASNASTACSITALDTSTGISVLTSGGQILNGSIFNATTNVATDVVATFGHNSTGTPATNFGLREVYQLGTSTTAGQDAVYIGVQWRTATHASRNSAYTISTAAAGVPSEALRIYRNTATQACTVIDTISAGTGLVIDIGSTFFALDVPNGSSSGGNARGTISVDLQTTRSNASEVASGTGAAILGGARNTVAGSYAYAIGDSCSAALGYTAATGQSALASKYGQFARSSVAGTLGSKQMSIYTMACATSSTTPKELRLDGDSGGQRLTVANNQCIYYYIQVVGKRATTQEIAIYEFIGAIDKATTAASTRIAVNNKTVVHEDDAGCDCDVTADTTNGALTITVTGTANGYTWVATIYATEVTI